MRHVFALLLLVVSAVFAGDVAPPGLEDIPLIVAEVNGRPIHRNDLVRELVAASAVDAVDRLVQRMVVEQEAAAQKIVVTDDEIEQQYKVDTQTLQSELVDMPWDHARGKTFSMEEIIRARFRMSIEEYKKLVVRQRLLIRRMVAKDLNPTNDQLIAFFQNETYRDLFQPPTRYRASHILISPFDPRDLHKGLRFRKPASQMAAVKRDRESRVRRIDLQRDRKIDLSEAPSLDPLDQEVKDARQRADRVLGEIKGNLVTWDQAVRKYTQDPLDHPYFDREKKVRVQKSEREQLKLPPGDVGWFTQHGPLVPQFYEGVKNLRPGEIGGPIETPYGFHIVKMLEVQEAPRVTFEEVRDKVLRMYVELEIQTATEEWLRELTLKANLKPNRTLFWPTASAAADVIPIGVETAQPETGAQADPVVGHVNGTPLKRSEIWRELLRADGEDALHRLINMEVVLSMLKPLGLARMEWETADKNRRAQEPPPSRPIKIKYEQIEKGMQDVLAVHDREAPEQSFREFLFERYGQTPDEYKRSVEAGLVLREAIRHRIQLDDATLQVQFALAKDNYAEPVWYEISHILIVPTGGMAKADKAAHLGAKTIADFVYRSYVQNPESFKQLVNEHSMDDDANKRAGGKLGECHPYATKELPDAPLLYDEILKQKLERGQASTPILTSRGYHIVKIDKVHPERPAQFGEVRDRLERDYLQERARMYSDIWTRLKDKRIVKHIYKSKDDDEPVDTFIPPKEDDDEKDSKKKKK